MTLEEFNGLPEEELKAQLNNCCGSAKWVSIVIGGRPYGDAQTLLVYAQSAWYKQCSPADWLEAFSRHPRIGDKRDITGKAGESLHLAIGEQSGVGENDTGLLRSLQAANIAYEEKLGFTFIVCATGKSGKMMLDLLEDRINNRPDEEMKIAMGEQWKITLIRLKKCLDEVDFAAAQSHITTHILDTSAGKPASGVAVHLYTSEDKAWKKIATGRTNEDGRIADLLPQCVLLEKNKYLLEFETAPYFTARGLESFYPAVQILFNINDDSHYHVPLLLNPFGYSTYRGS